MSDRDAQGKFQKGGPGGPGRPAKARELAYLAVLREEVTLEDWRRVIQAAKADATNASPLDGPTRDKARRFLADYLIGRPAQTIHLDDEQSVYDAYDELSDEALEAIVAGRGGPGPAGAPPTDY